MILYYYFNNVFAISYTNVWLTTVLLNMVARVLRTNANTGHTLGTQFCEYCFV